MQHYDAVIIGSGLGGLSAGAKLAKEGQKVLVLEQHSLIGGCATCFKRKGMRVDAGLHELDYGDPSTDMKHLVFEKLGIKDKIQIVPLPSAWSVAIQSTQPEKREVFTIPHGTENVKKALKEKFPHESEGIDAYFKAIKTEAYAVRRFPWDMSFWDFYFFPLTTAWIPLKNKLLNPKVSDVLNKMIKDDKLKRILNINISYYHHDPKEFIWSFHAIPQKHYYEGGAYAKGGSQSISDALSAVIQENGGEVRAKCDVKEILTEGNRAIGVRFTHQKEDFEVYGSNIIANCDPDIVYNQLLKDKGIDLSADTQQIQDLPLAVSLVSAYIIYDKNISEIYPDMDYSTFIMPDRVYEAPFSESNALDRPMEDRPVAFVNYSKIDSGLSEKEDRYLGVLALASVSKEWEGLSEEEYKEKKARLLENLIAKLDEQYPNLSSHMIHSELATPLTIKRYTRAREGSPYGYSQDNEGSKYRASWKSKSVENLYFASAFTYPGGGFTGAILGGYNTACRMLKPNFILKRVIFNVVVSTAVSLGIVGAISALF